MRSAADVAREGDSYFERVTGGALGTRWHYRRLADALSGRADELTPDWPDRPGAAGLLTELFRAIERFGATAEAAAAYEAEAQSLAG